MMRLFLMLLAAAAPVAAQTGSLLPPGPATPALSLPPPTAAVRPAPIIAAPPVAVIAPATTSGVLRAGTEVELKTAEYLTTQHKDLRIGQRVRLEVSDNVTFNGRIVIPAGAPAMAEITDVRNKGMWGKSGHFNARILYVRVGDR